MTVYIWHKSTINFGKRTFSGNFFSSSHYVPAHLTLKILQNVS